MWSWTPEAAELLAAIAFAIGARVIDAKPWRRHPVPTPKPPKYDDHAHAERVRKLLSKRLETLPTAALVTLLEAATLLEAGEPLDTLVARQKLGTTDPKGRRRLRVETGMTRSERAMIRRQAADEAAMEAGVEATLTAMPWMQRRRPI